MLSSSGIPLSERDPRAVSEFLLAGQSECGVTGREGNCSAGYPRQGRVAYLLICLMLENVKIHFVTPTRLNFRALGGSPPCCLKSFRA